MSSAAFFEALQLWTPYHFSDRPNDDNNNLTTTTTTTTTITIIRIKLITSCGARHNKPRPCCHLANDTDLIVNASPLSYGR